MLNYKNIGDNLTVDEFNAMVSLLRHFNTIKKPIQINEQVTGDYGVYSFGLDGATMVADGILISDETLTHNPTVKLTNCGFKHSTYNLTLQIIHYSSLNVFDDDVHNYKNISTLNIELEEDNEVLIPLDDLEIGDIISFDGFIEIKHDKPTIDVNKKVIELSADKNIIQTNDTDNLTAFVHYTDGTIVAGETVEFYELYDYSKLVLSGDKSIIQTDEAVTLKAVLKDEDGSLIEGETVDLFVDDPSILYLNDEEVSWSTRNSSTIYDNTMSVKLPTNCEITFDIWSDNSNSSSEHRFFLMPKQYYNTGTTQPTDALYFDYMGSNHSQFGKRESDTSYYFVHNLAVTGSTYHTIKLVKNGKEVEFYIDDNLKTTQTIDWIDNYTDYTLSMMRWSASGTSRIRNVEIRR